MSAIQDRGFGMMDATGTQTEQVVSIAATSGQSSAFASTTKVVRLAANNACFVKFGANPTASATDGHYIGTGSDLWAKVNSGDKVAVISHNTVASGKLTICEMKSEF